ncbi:MAG: hypothetical protein CVU56_22980 [Deltaproteobacteria bacterium HGW-Deltaproteobacteria-14]|jgi:hypothetical protein|nr:MAG: hypothetical protein CVU56_22980 [Deltaproteobacteria bacterium HGW-Deltaproteobacteria-14]
MTTDDHDPSAEAGRAKSQAEADRAALDRLYGPKKRDAHTQSWVGIALLVFGPVLILVGAAMDGDPRLIGVGVLALAVGVWAFFDGLARARRARREDDARPASGG